MKHNRNPLATAIQYALGAGVVAGLAMTAAPLAAQDQEEEVADLDRVQVTGTRLSRVDIEGAQPVNIITREDVERIGLNDLGEVLRQLPAVTGSPLSTATNNGTDGSSLTSLRGFGPARTLVLINGRRQNGASDFSTLPLAAIERIEVLKEGASAIYGADAVAGVVNVITRRDFQGAQVQVQYGESFEMSRNPAADLRPEWAGSDGDVGRFSVVIGDVSERGNYVMGLERSKQDPVYQGNIGKPQFNNVIGGLGGVLADGFPECLEIGSCNATGGSASSLGGFFQPRSIFGNVDGFGYTRDLDTAEIRQFGAVPGDAYNFAPVNYIQQPFTRTSAFAFGEYDLFDGHTLFVEARWSNRRSEQELAPTPLTMISGAGFDPGFPLEDGGFGIPANNAFNPFGEDVLDVRRRVAEGRRRFEQDVVRTQINGGLRGELPFFGPTWTYEASVNYGRTNWTNTDFGQFVGQNFVQAIGPSFFDDAGNAVCGTPESPIAGCVPMNVFGGFGTITQDMLDFAGAELIDRFDTTLLVMGGSIAGDLFELPAGPVGFAIGYEYREEKLASIPDSGKATDSVTGNTFGKTEGKFDVNSWFAEVNIPILADLPGARLLEVGAGVRVDDFSTIGDTTNMMLTGRWQPFRDLLVRGSYSEVFREPTIFNLFSPQGDSFPSFQDPCSAGWIDDPDSNLYATLSPEEQARCRAGGVPDGGYFQTSSQPRARIGGNPDVGPEEGETVTVGIAYSPSLVPGLTLTVDYWEIDLDDAIQGIGAQSVVDQCIRQGNQDLCDAIDRRASGEIDRVLSLTRNIGNLKGSGLDFELAYQRSTGIGLWNFRTLWTYLDELKATVLVGDTVDAAGKFEQRNGLTEGVYPEWSGFTAIDWSLGDFGASISWEYIDSVDEFDTGRTVESKQYWDVTGRYNTPWGTQVAAGLTNVFNESPPFIINGFNANTDPDTYRMLGRSWFVRLTHNF